MTERGTIFLLPYNGSWVPIYRRAPSPSSSRLWLRESQSPLLVNAGGADSPKDGRHRESNPRTSAPLTDGLPPGPQVCVCRYAPRQVQIYLVIKREQREATAPKAMREKPLARWSPRFDVTWSRIMCWKYGISGPKTFVSSISTGILRDISYSSSRKTSVVISSDEQVLVHDLAAIVALVSPMIRECAKLLSQRAGWELKIKVN